MEKNTVVLDIELYNELRDIKKNVVEDGKCYVINQWNNAGYSSSSGYGYGNGYKPYYFLEENEVVKDFEAKIEILEKEIQDLKNPKNPIDLSRNRLRSMSYWEFRKLKKQL